MSTVRAEKLATVKPPPGKFATQYGLYERNGKEYIFKDLVSKEEMPGEKLKLHKNYNIVIINRLKNNKETSLNNEETSLNVMLDSRSIGSPISVLTFKHFNNESQNVERMTIFIDNEGKGYDMMPRGGTKRRRLNKNRKTRSKRRQRTMKR